MAHLPRLTVQVLLVLIPSILANTFDLEEGYDKYEVPKDAMLQDSPLPVNFSLNLRNILGVDEKASQISLEISLRMFWKDHRVKPVGLSSSEEYAIISPSAFDQFWIPDIFIDRAKKVRNPTFHQAPASIRVYNDSRFRYSKRINFDVACQMDFRLYPVDKQVCEIKFESFGYTSQDMTLQWIDGSFTTNPNITLDQFLWKADLSDSYETAYYQQHYPGVILRISLERQLPYHLCQTYLPSVIIVTIAWLSMFVSPESIPGRVTFGMTTLLTLTAMFGAERSNVPRVSYVTLLDVWMIGCTVFVFISLLEFTTVASLLRAGQKRKSEKVEMVSRFVFPFMFLIFNTVYWVKIFKQH